MNFDPDYPAGLTRSWYRIPPTSSCRTWTVSRPRRVDPARSHRGRPVIEIDGTTLGADTGITVDAANSTVRGFVIRGFGNNAIGVGDGDNVVMRGTTSGPTSAARSARTTATTASTSTASPRAAVIGGTTAADRNIISGNDGNGIIVAGPHRDQLAIHGNYIGTDVTGHARPRQRQRRHLPSRARPTNNTIGGTAAGRAQRHLRQRRGRHRHRDIAHDRQRGPGQLHRHRRRPARSDLGNGRATASRSSTAPPATPSAAPRPLRATSSPATARTESRSTARATSNHLVQGNYIGTDGPAPRPLANAITACISPAAQPATRSAAPRPAPAT